LEEFCVRLDDLGSSISENQFMIHVLNNLPIEYNLQLALLEERIGDTDKPIIVEEIRAELRRHFEIFNMKSRKNKTNEKSEEHALFSGQFKVKWRNCERIGHKLFRCKVVQATMVEITVTRLKEIIDLIVTNRDMSGRTTLN
jgi:orotate phosphoribosyltransferase-like protein